MTHITFLGKDENTDIDKCDYQITEHNPFCMPSAQSSSENMDH